MTSTALLPLPFNVEKEMGRRRRWFLYVTMSDAVRYHGGDGAEGDNKKWENGGRRGRSASTLSAAAFLSGRKKVKRKKMMNAWRMKECDQKTGGGVPVEYE